MKRHKRNNIPLRGPAGQVMVLALLFLVVVLILVTSLYSRVIGFVHFGSRQTIGEQAIALAEAGVDYALLKLNQTNGNFSGQPTIELGAGEFKLTIDPAPPRTLAKVTSTGCIPNCTSPIQKRVIKVEVTPGEELSLLYTAHSGLVDVDMVGSCFAAPPCYQRSYIKGDVYSSRRVDGSCSNPSFDPCVIEGDVWAIDTIDSSIRIIGNAHPHTFPPPVPIPQIDEPKWQAAAANPSIGGGVTICGGSGGTCQIKAAGTIDLGPQKYVGKVEIEPLSGQNLTVVIKGPIYVTDSLVFNGGINPPPPGRLTIVPDSGLGSNGTVIINDGKFVIRNTEILTTTPPLPLPKGYLLFTSTNSIIEISQPCYFESWGIFLAPRSLVTLRKSGDCFPPAPLPADGLISKIHGALAAKGDISIETGWGLFGDPNLKNITLVGSGAWQIKRGTYKFANSN